MVQDGEMCLIPTRYLHDFCMHFLKKFLIIRLPSKQYWQLPKSYAGIICKQLQIARPNREAGNVMHISLLW